MSRFSLLDVLDINQIQSTGKVGVLEVLGVLPSQTSKHSRRQSTECPAPITSLKKLPCSLEGSKNQRGKEGEIRDSVEVLEAAKKKILWGDLIPSLCPHS